MRRDRKLFTLISLLLAVSSNFILPTPHTPHLIFPASAQTMDDRKAEADRLLKQGNKQWQANQFKSAIQSFQQALTIYQSLKDRKSEGKALHNIGFTYNSLEDYNSSIKFYQQSLAVAQEIKDPELEARDLLEMGISYRNQGDYAQAIKCQQKSLIIARRTQYFIAEGRALSELGLVYSSMGEMTKAIDCFQQSLSIAQKHYDRDLEAKVFYNLGNLYVSKLDYDKATDYYQKSLLIRQETRDRQGENAVLSKLAKLYFDRKEYSKAIDHFQQSLAILREHGKRHQEMTTLGVLALSYGQIGNYKKEIELQQQSLVIARELQDQEGELRVLQALGDNFDSLSSYDQAIEYKQQSLALAKKLRDTQSEKQALNTLVLAHNSKGDYIKAIDYAEQLLSFAQRVRDHNLELQALDNLGFAHSSLGNDLRSISCYKQQLSIAEEIRDRQAEWKALKNLGGVYSNLAEYAQSIQHYQQALVITKEIKDPKKEAEILGGLAQSYRGLGDSNKAIKYGQQSLALARRFHNRIEEWFALHILSDAYLLTEDYKRGIEYLQQNLTIGQELNKQKNIAMDLVSLGLAYSFLGNRTKAIEYFQKSLVSAQQAGETAAEGQALHMLGMTLFEVGKLVEAEFKLRAAIKVWESLRTGLGNRDDYKIAIFEDQAETYNVLQQVLIAQKKFDTALEVAEQGRTRAFVELLTKRLSVKREQDAKITKKLPSTAYTPIAPSLGLQQIKQIAQQHNATIVEYSTGYSGLDRFRTFKSDIFIWVIKPTGEVTFRKVDLKPLWQHQHTSLEALTLTSRRSIGVRGLPIRAAGGLSHNLLALQLKQNQETAKANLRQLHQLLIQPIADLLPQDSNQRVIFIPQGSLFLVPFPALLDANGKYLIEQHTILTAPSIQVLDLTRQQQRKGVESGESGVRNALVVGNPIMPSVPFEPGEQPQPLPSLPGAEKEAAAIAPLLHTQAITGRQATKAEVVQKMQQALIIHLATHGILDDLRGLGSAIALAPDPAKPQEDQFGHANGLLTAEEILNLKLNTDLVVLSACNTGRGRITGDGVIGLSRSLITAGVPSIIVSLWQVPDNSTALLMTEFYKNLQQYPDKAQALRQAMLTTKAKYPAPLDWAAFTLIGEAE